MTVFDGQGNKQVNDKRRPGETRMDEFKRHREEDKLFRQSCENVGFNDLDKFSRKGKLGEGTYGLVTKAVHNVSRMDVAIKKFKPEAEDVGLPPTTVREIALLSELQHPYIVPLIHTIFFKGNVHLVFEFCEYDLKKYMDMCRKQSKKVGLPLLTVQRFLYQMCKAIEFCHLNRIYHRDMKPKNVLVTGDGDRIKIADFGLARQHSIPLSELTREVVTL